MARQKVGSLLQNTTTTSSFHCRLFKVQTDMEAGRSCRWGQLNQPMGIGVCCEAPQPRQDKIVYGRIYVNVKKNRWMFPKNRGIPKWMVKIMENPLKWMIWGYHYLWKHPDVYITSLFQRLVFLTKLCRTCQLTPTETAAQNSDEACLQMRDPPKMMGNVRNKTGRLTSQKQSGPRPFEILVSSRGAASMCHYRDMSNAKSVHVHSC